MGIFLTLGILYGGYILYLVITAIRGILKEEKEYKTLFAAGLMLFSEVIFTIAGPIIGFLRYDQYGPQIPFAKQHVLMVIMLTVSSSASFWLARFTANTNNLFVRIILSAGMLQGMILCVLVSIHFIAFIPMGIIFPWAGFELLSPFVAFFLLYREFYFYNKVQVNPDEMLPYRKELGFEPLTYKIIAQPFFIRLLIYTAMIIGFVILQMLIGYAMGMDIDSLVKAFTQSVGFVFSTSNR